MPAGAVISATVVTKSGLMTIITGLPAFRRAALS